MDLQTQTEPAEAGTRSAPTASGSVATAAPASTRKRHRRGGLALMVGSVIAALGLLAGGLTSASAGSRTPTRGDSIPNIGVVETQIKAYYGDTVLANGDHVPSATGNYAREMARIEATAERYLRHAAVTRDHHRADGKPAIVLDVDDTTLNTYNYEIASGFAYNPVTNAEYVNGARFPAVPGMPALANWAARKGITVFFLTGRPETQRAGTVTNLTKVGYDVPTDVAHLYLKYTAGNQPSYIQCATATCTTTEYKSQTRKHIESLGYSIVADFGDQYSDLNGGYTLKTFKIPNPMYYLP